MMRRPVYSVLAFTLLSYPTCLVSVADSEGFEISDDVFGLLSNSDFDMSTDVDIFDPGSNFFFTSDDQMTVDLPEGSNNLLEQDDIFDEDLTLISDDECSFDAAFLDADGSLEPFQKRGSGQECKSPPRGAGPNKIPSPPGGPQDFLNNLPLFEPYEKPVLHPNPDFCDPDFVRDRDIPMCLIGMSDRALDAGDWWSGVGLIGCAPFDPLVGKCPAMSRLVCCKYANIDTKIHPDYEMPGIMAQSDVIYNLDRCDATECLDTTGLGITPFKLYMPVPAIPTQTPY